MTQGNRVANREEIVAAVRAAGVTTGDGTPGHVALGRPADTVIANACECEPLVFSARHLLLHHAAEVVEGLRLAMEAAGARRGVVAFTDTRFGLEAAIRAAAAGQPGIEVFKAPDFYPVGEDYIITYEATGRTVPSAGSTGSVGVSVFSVETLFDVCMALRGKPVTHRSVSVCGEVAQPAVFRIPVGASLADVLQQAGGVTAGRFRVLMGGPISGPLAEDLAEPVTKRTAALLVLPTHHIQVQKRARSLSMMLLRARSVCPECRDCTDSCARYLVGQEIEPHRIMRAICYSLDSLNTSITSAVHCNECGICDSYVCKMGISPRVICREIKAHLAAMGWQRPQSESPASVRESYASNHLSLEALTARLGVGKYVEALDVERMLNSAATMDESRLRGLSLPLLQHAGAPAAACVGVGDIVDPDQLIGEIPADHVGARVHAGLGGVVGAVGECVEILGPSAARIDQPLDPSSVQACKT